jgi:hypothetical protein
MTIPLDRRPLAAGANGGGIKATSKNFSKLLQNSRVSLPAFPNKVLAVLCDFNGLQGFQVRGAKVLARGDLGVIFLLGGILESAFL